MSGPTTTTESNPLRQALPRTQVPEPCAIVLFGATGDLAHRKLVPALFRLAQGGNLPSECAIVGFARRDWTDDDLPRRVPEDPGQGSRAAPISRRSGRSSPAGLVFVPGTFDDPARLPPAQGAARARSTGRTARGGTASITWRCRPSSSRRSSATWAGGDLIYPWQQASPWSRVVIEKPFGHDLESALALNLEVSHVLDESQVYRIDHYLGKETVQNILALRFGNTIFEPIWDRRYVHSVQVTVAEEVGMAGGRGAYYDTAGTIRDMVQNHMMQLLSLVAMEPPVDLSAVAVRNEKVKVLQALPQWKPEDVYRNVVRAQYTAGSIHGTEVPGYRQEKGVAPDFEDG